MKHGITLLLCLFFISILLVGCSDQAESEVQQDAENVNENEGESKNSEEDEHVEYLYENKDMNLFIANTPGWEITEKESEASNIFLKHGQARAIVSVLNTEKSYEELKEEILAGANNVNINTNNDGYLSFQTNRKESMQTDVYLEQRANDTVIISFVAPTKLFEELTNEIKSLRTNINY